MPAAAELPRICNSMALQDPDLSIWKIYANTHTLPPRIKSFPLFPQPTNIPELQRPFGSGTYLHPEQSHLYSLGASHRRGSRMQAVACAGSIGNETHYGFHSLDLFAMSERCQYV